MDKKHKEFADDWTDMIATIRSFSAKYNLENPTLLMHPQWKQVLGSSIPFPDMPYMMSEKRYNGIPLHFGFIETGKVIR